MKGIFLICILVSVAFADLTCDGNKVYTKILKQSKSYANEESFGISSGSTVIYQSPALVSNELRTIETCLDASTNSQYTLTMADSYGDSWSSGSWIEIHGINGNIVYKGYLTNTHSESYTISFYTPINKNEQWKFSTNASGNWYDASYSDASWSTQTLGSGAATQVGTQYFRKTFTGLADMAAYELSMNYRYGIVAYINGVEIYRDNMPEGVPTTSTAATGGYSLTEYHSVIRPGLEVAATNSILAVELHFVNTGANAVDFNAFLAIYASGHSEKNCYVYPYGAEVTSDATSGTPANAWDWTKYGSFSVTNFVAPLVVNAAMDVNHVPYVNGWRLYTYTSQNYMPSGYTITGSMSVSGEYEPIFTSISRTYTTKTMDMKTTLFNGRLARNLRFSITSASNAGNSIYIYEMQPAICNLGAATGITYSQATYSYYATYEEVNIAPIVDEFINCNINPMPSAGLTFDSATCKLSGKAEGTTASTTVYTVSSILNGQTYTGSFTLNIQICTGSFLNIRRMTKTNAYAEAYSITDLTTNQVVVQQTINGGQSDNSDITEMICTNAGKYRLTMSSALNFYYPYSFVVLGILLSGSEYESLGLFNVDNILGTPSSYDFKTTLEIPTMSNWHYKMGDVPANWFSSDVSGWSEAHKDTFPASSNQIQLYKKTFQVASLVDAPTIALHLRYQHGVIVYLNNNEVFRRGVDGQLSTASFATTAHSTLKYYSIYIPVTTFGSPNAPSTNNVQVGSNTIAIALVAANAQQTAATFDAVIRVTGENHSNRVFGTTTTWFNVNYAQTASDAFIGMHNLYIYRDVCDTSNYLNVLYSNDRREWISSIVLQNWHETNEKNVGTIRIEGKNPDDASFVLIKEVTGLKWSYPGQTKRIWLNHNIPYNQIRLSNIGSGDPNNCAWRLNRIGLYTDVISDPAPALSYQPASVTIFKDVEMAEVYANSELFRDFTVNPPFPGTISVDVASGMISGTANAEQAAQTYIISATKYNTGEIVTATFSLEVTVCTGGKSLITLTVQTDNNPSQGSYKVHQGKGTTGQVVSQVDAFPFANSLYYADFCLPHGMYTLQAIATGAEGWANPAGYMLTVDIGSMRFEVGQVPTTQTTYFSSFLPFQVEYDDWKIYKETAAVPAGWNTEDFDDSTWSVSKAAAIGTSEAVTVYARRTINIDDISNYQVLNVRVKYVGGVVAYFNGRKVARFNLDEVYNAETESIAVHDSTLFSKFHIILSTVGAKSGNNVIAFEIHRPKGHSSAGEIVFDATGVFGVNDCSVVVDTFESLDASNTVGSSIEEQFELAPYYSGYISNAQGSFIEWIVENLEGSKFNSFGMQTPQASSGYSLSLYGYTELEGDERTSILERVNQAFTERQRNAFDVPVGIAGFRRLRFEVDMAADTPVYVTTYLTQYCKAAGTGGCPAVDDYPSVGEGQISPSVCPDGFRGYSYRTCSNGQLGEVMTDKCTHKQPAFLKYPVERYYFVKDAENESDAPEYQNVITRFYLDENVKLPDGIKLDEITGKFYGKPTVAATPEWFTVFGSNPAGVTSTAVVISVREGECKSEGVWETTKVGVTATYDCSLKGSYFGTQSRVCVLGTRDGEWQKVSGMCVPITLVWILIAVVIIAIVVIIIVLKSKGKKANKKTMKPAKSSKKSASKKETKKEVKL